MVRDRIGSDTWMRRTGGVAVRSGTGEIGRYAQVPCIDKIRFRARGQSRS
jgi:hypothetical protein